MNARTAALGAELREIQGPRIGWNQLRRILEDRTCVRYPCEVVFEVSEMQAGGFRHPVAKGACPEAGFLIYVHPYFVAQLEQVPRLVLHQLVLVKYSGFASSDDAETFGAAALGLPRDEYYSMLCALADELLPPAPRI